MASIDTNQLIRQLKLIYGANAEFRDGQLEAIQAVLSGERTLVVQKTGWGKSLIYFMSAYFLRKQGRGPCIVISPLLALMNNQIEAAALYGLTALAYNSQNREQWSDIEEKIQNNGVDVLFISPERLADQEFVSRILSMIAENIGMLVVDEAHCISDWGHDFRPDYRRIVNIVQQMPENVPILATTATANNRVIDDIVAQFGKSLHILRGELTRESLYIQIIHLNHKEERLAWLLENVSKFSGTGIIYCLTVQDCITISAWLVKNGIDAYAYTGQMETETRYMLERKFLENGMKVLVATVAYGMGIDKPDISFVIHFQKPGNVVAYYQQIGRAGRAIQRAYAILLVGAEDDVISEYFIKTAFPLAKELNTVVQEIDSSDGIKRTELLHKINMKAGRLDNALKFLLINGDVYSEKSKYFKSPKPWIPDLSHSEQITKMRFNELDQMNCFVQTKNCYMEFVAKELNDASAHPCGHCGNCNPVEGFPTSVTQERVVEALAFLRGDNFTISPRKRWPDNKAIKPEETYETGFALSNYGDAGWGRVVSKNKYKNHHFSDDLVEASVDILRRHCLEWNIDVVTSVPSLRRPLLVRDFAERVAAKLGLVYIDSITKVTDTPEQKTMQNSAFQLENVLKSFQVVKSLSGNVLLIDDMVDSRWTLTVCSQELLQNGAAKVYVFALANTSGGGGTDS